MLQKLRDDELQVEKPLAELDNLGHTDWVRCGSAPDPEHWAQPPHPGVCAWRAWGGPAGAKGRFRLLGGPGPAVGPAHAGAPPWSEAEEGAGARVQPLAHRVPAHPLRDVDAGHPRQEL